MTKKQYLSPTREHNVRGHQYNLYKETCQKDVRRYSFKCRVTNQWNNLPETIVNSPSLNTFKNRLDNLWERDGVMFDPDVDVYATTSSRLTSYVRIGAQKGNLVLEAYFGLLPESFILLY